MRLPYYEHRLSSFRIATIPWECMSNSLNVLPAIALSSFVLWKFAKDMRNECVVFGSNLEMPKGYMLSMSICKFILHIWVKILSLYSHSQESKKEILGRKIFFFNLLKIVLLGLHLPIEWHWIMRTLIHKVFTIVGKTFVSTMVGCWCFFIPGILGLGAIASPCKLLFCLWIP